MVYQRGKLLSITSSLLLYSTYARTVAFTSYFADDSCSGTPQFIYEEDVESCQFTDCTTLSVGDAANSTRVDCYGNDRTETAALFADADAPYVLLEQYTPANTCDTFANGQAFYADGLCRALPNTTSYGSAIASVNQDLSVALKLFSDTTCSEVESNYSIASTDVQWTCYVGFTADYGLVFYTSASKAYSSTSGDGSTTGSDFTIVNVGSNSSSGSTGSGETSTTSQPVVSGSGDGSGSSIGGGIIAGIAVGCVVLVALIAAFIWWRRKKGTRSSEGSRRGKDTYGEGLLGEDPQGRTLSTQPGASSDFSGGEGLWNDEAIIAARIPREKVLLQQRISRGGYGEVFVGTFNGQRVAVKMLLPETRKRIQSVNEFLAEVKLMASLEHPRIVEFIGVAWDSLTDLCVVSQFMEGGDLRALLNRYPSLGFDYTKVKIALHVAHALTYMHSLEPPLIHRDLKSKNILLTEDLDAKLTDFGASRERVDRTMTAGIGTSLWMAPEMMTGEKYDEKADMFSFGVVLSELDSNALPYANTGKNRQASDLAILQLVMQGNLRVEFSETCPPVIMELGLACVSIDPTARPTAAQALYQLQVALAEQQ
ncbi:Serine/threonine-protein kinase STY17 [Phytophthora citrophthora]|uniref:Serine/threonine-protein kinase STY17 n=1 Tax=Phytophthora citrophthora TaxID=4793 RepID=A0AAD9LAS7_9STRA|nr:Serine/threonine-protein kinase STY17 [Phytophthora citrophthora]